MPSLTRASHARSTAADAASNRGDPPPPSSSSSSSTSSSTRWSGGDAASLDAWLRASGVDTARFGVGDAKSLDDLAEEVARGEATVTLDPRTGAPLRSVRVLQLLLRDAAGRVLVEARQEWSDGRVRERGTPLSEKMLGGESWRDAAPRAVAEELGSALAPGYELVVDEATLQVRNVARDSVSYPGLPSLYAMHAVEAALAPADAWPPNAPVTTATGSGGGDGAESNARVLGEGFVSVEATKRGTITATWVWREGFEWREGADGG